ncbi:MAG: Transcriptional regulator, AbrB family [Candidatus Magasanikbacteria bacterium GW2011_GWC2_37_14]|uniref:Transcriptional regulator, AbrB family n=1 Tax=Candidatus Magasanikbacteria bacterium GW2011_GWC2_37_14 TaxID=1619046 RepID=A0A0G0IVR8_9BACT|nr:MAG: Transcriptional regulator, AbrB family [Candidatus Magasanikbacteria bacterium GW2011_GWC2_37_14]
MKQSHNRHPFGNMCGATSLGERGQLVIPKEAREALKTKTGDQFIVFEHDGFLILIPEKIMSKMVSQVTKVLNLNKKAKK